MLDKVYYKSKKEVVLIYTHRSPVTLWSDENILEFLDMFLAPIGSNCDTLSEYVRRVAIGEEDTQVIHIDDVA